MQRAVLQARALDLEQRLRGIELELGSGDCLVLTDPNGSGKSSLVRALLGLERPTGGSVSLDGQPISSLSQRERAARVAWLPQRPTLVEPRRTEELVASARFRFRESSGVAEGHARAALLRLDAGHLIGRRTDRISGGELQRVLLATLIAQEAPLLLVDEPANHLDPLQQATAYRALGQLFRAGHGLLVVTHELALARFLGDPARILVMGLSAGQGAFLEKLDSPSLPAALRSLSGVPYRTGPRPGDVAIDWGALE